MSSKLILNTHDWNPAALKYMAPKVNKSGGKSIVLLSTQTNKGLALSTPMMTTWGASDFTDANTGESDGKFSMSLNFPNADYSTPEITEFLEKLKQFENQVIDDAVSNSLLWWGEPIERSVLKHTFFPIIKYSKNPDTKRIDLTRPPTIRAKIPFYDGKWGVEVYDLKCQQLFPSETNPDLNPIDFITKGSTVGCMLKCGGIWIGGKGWGVTWKAVQVVVKPNEIETLNGKCHVQVPFDYITSSSTAAAAVAVKEEVVTATSPKRPISTLVQDSDEEESEGEDEVEEPPTKVRVAEPPSPVVAAAAPSPVVAAAAPSPVVAAAAAAPVVAAAAATPVVAAAAVVEPPKKKVVKKAAVVK